MAAGRAEFASARLHPSAGLKRVVLVMGGITAFAGGAGALMGADFGFIAALMGLLAPTWLVALWASRGAPKGGEGLSADRAGLWVGGELQVPRGEVQRAMVVVERGTSMVVLQGSRRTMLVDVASEEEGHALVAGLGLDASQTTSEFSFDAPPLAAIPPWAYWAYLFLPLALIPLALAGSVALMLAAMLAWYAGLALAAVPRKAVVGLDGVLVKWLWSKELIAFRDLSFEEDEHGITLRRRGGGSHRLSAYWMGKPWERGWWKKTHGFGSRKAYVDAVVSRIQRAKAASDRGEGGAAAWLSRSDREPRAWLAELRGLLSPRREGFRSNPPEAEELWATLEDARQAPATRAAAAVALAPALDAAGKDRLGGAAATVVNPRLRVALEASSRGDDEALLEALEGLEAEAAPRAAR